MLETENELTANGSLNAPYTDVIPCILEHSHGEGIIFGSRNHNIYILKDEKWKILQGHTSSVTCLAESPDGSIVSGSHDNTVRVWKMGADSQWGCQVVLQGHTSNVTCLVVRSDGSIVSGSGSHDNTVRVWEMGAGGQWDCQVLRGHSQGVSQIALLSDGSIVSGDNDGLLCIWRKDRDNQWTRQSSLRSSHGNGIYALSVLPHDNIVTGDSGGDIFIWKRGADGQWNYVRLQGHQSWISSLVTDPRDGSIISASADRTVRVWKNPLQKLRDRLTNQQALIILFMLQNKALPEEGTQAHTIWMSVDKAIRAEIKSLLLPPEAPAPELPLAPAAVALNSDDASIPRERSLLRRCMQSRPVQIAALIGTVITLYRLAPNQIRVWIRNNFAQVLRMIKTYFESRVLHYW